MFVEIDRILSNIDSFSGREVAIHGRIFLDVEDRIFIAADVEAFLDQRKLLVDEPGKIAKELWSRLSPYGGGPSFYKDLVWITGTIVNTNGETNLVNVRECVIRRGDVEIAIRPAKDPDCVD